MNLKNKIRSLTNNLQCLPWKILSKTNIYKDKSSPIKYVSEEANWAIKNVGENIKREVDKITPHKFELCTNPAKLTNKIENAKIFIAYYIKRVRLIDNF